MGITNSYTKYLKHLLSRVLCIITTRFRMMFMWSLRQEAWVRKYCWRRSPMRQGDPGGAFTSGEVGHIIEVCQTHPFHILCYYWLLKTLSLLYILGLFSLSLRSLEHFVITMNVSLQLLLVLWKYFSQSDPFTISFALSFNLSQVKTYSAKTKTKIKTQTKQPSIKKKTKVQYNVPNSWKAFPHFPKVVSFFVFRDFFVDQEERILPDCITRTTCPR